MAQTAFNSQSLTTLQGVVELLKSSQNQQEFDQNCETIKQANGGRYPNFFNKQVIFSGVYEECQQRFAQAEVQAGLNEQIKDTSVVDEAVQPRVALANQATLNAQSMRAKPVIKP
jgi:hypothetical protein